MSQIIIIIIKKAGTQTNRLVYPHRSQRLGCPITRKGVLGPESVPESRRRTEEGADLHTTVAQEKNKNIKIKSRLKWINDLTGTE